jgi:hypothetical protein
VLAGQRWYIPQLTRWLSRDPIKYEGGVNLYQYVAANPVNYIDPSGLWRFPWSDTPGMPFNLPFGPNREKHINRNKANVCPSYVPLACEVVDREDFEYDDWFEKWRGTKGSECAFDERGNLLPDENANYTFDFAPKPITTGHIWNDVVSHYWYGGKEAYKPGVTVEYQNR